METLEENPARPWEARALALAKAVCLVGFPLVPMLVYLSRRHPALGGFEASDQIAALAAAAERWAQVHFAFSVGGFLAIAALLVLRREVALRAPALWTNTAAAVGVVGGVIFTGTVLMEVQVIPALSRACAATPACLSRENGPFAGELADQGWRVLPGLGLGGKTMMLGLALLAVLGVLYGSLRNWEGGALFFGAVLEIGKDTGLHAWGNFRLADGAPAMAAVAILVGGCGVALRLLTNRPAEAAAAAQPAPLPPPVAGGSAPDAPRDAGDGAAPNAERSSEVPAEAAGNRTEPAG